MGKKERRKNCAPSITEGEIGKKKAEIVRAGGKRPAARPNCKCINATMTMRRKKGDAAAASKKELKGSNKTKPNSTSDSESLNVKCTERMH